MRQATAQRRYEIYHPSGEVIALTGAFGLSRAGDGTVLGPMVVSGERAQYLDPRAVVVADGARAYDPRQILLDGGCLDTDTEAWLAEHPEWPAILE